jgi:DNA replication protein DnaC
MGSNLAKWEAFNWDRHPKLRPAKKVIVDWYNGLPDSGALVLAGDVGCGKTHLADAIADLYGRWRLSFYEEIELITKIQETYSDKTKSQERVFNDLFRPSLLILDDLGTYETANWSFLSNVYNRIFNDYLTVKKKPVLITTNIPMYLYDDEGNIIPGGMAERIGARSFSRLCDALGKLDDGRYIDLFGIEDMRIEGYLE